MRRIDRKLSSARFLPLDHNIISRHKIWILLHLQILVHTEIYIFLALKWRIKLMNRLRTEGENIIYVRSLQRCVITKRSSGSLYKPTLTVKHAIRFGLFIIPSTPNYCVQ